MSSITPNSFCIQYADDSTLNRSYKINQKYVCIKELEKDLTSIAKWTIETILVFNTGQTKFMLIASKQLSARHKLKDEQLQICCNNTELERVTESKLFATWFNYRWKSNAEQSYIKNAKRLLFKGVPKKPQTIHLTVRTQTVRRIVNLFKIRLL